MDIHKAKELIELNPGAARLVANLLTDDKGLRREYAVRLFRMGEGYQGALAWNGFETKESLEISGYIYDFLCTNKERKKE